MKEGSSQTNQVQYAERESNGMNGRVNDFGRARQARREIPRETDRRVTLIEVCGGSAEPMKRKLRADGTLKSAQRDEWMRTRW